MANVLHASIRRILSDVPAEETTLIASDLQHQFDLRVSLGVPVYQLKDDKKIWQLASVEFEHLSDLFTDDGRCILKVSSSLCALFYDGLHLGDSIQIRDSNGTKYIKIGPQYESFVLAENQRHRVAGRVSTLHRANFDPVQS
ncbi:hypothetical protein MPSEU_000527000 [Mayamaea pseudoterrestris]|nr:hypothetical protein MPSEU_000527000 [Mayamaea pseudoterrestris]